MQHGFADAIAEVGLQKLLPDLFWIGMLYHLYNQVAANTLERVAPLTHAVGNVLKLTRYKSFKEGHKRLLDATNLVGRGIDIERVNIVLNYDMPDSTDTYLYRVGRAVRFGTKGLAITFVSSASDSDVLNHVSNDIIVDMWSDLNED